MGWSEVAACSHARRLEQQGWLVRYPMTRGEGSLFVATRNGNRVLAVSLRAAGVPAPTWWAHHCGCAWMAAWLGLRGHRFLGDRELLEDRAWSGEISWHDRKGYHDAHHRPDLVGTHKEGWHTPIEVELAQKSIERLRAILGMHASWRAYRRTGGVIYVCGNQDGCDRVKRVAEKSGSFPAGSIGLRIELLDTIEREAIQMSEQSRAARSSRSVGDLQPAGDRAD
jgi:hypothetical protein